MRLSSFAYAAFILATTVSSAHAGALLAAYDQAKINDRAVAASEFQRDAALQSRPLVRSALLPQINAQLGYAIQNQENTYSTSRFGSPMPVSITQESDTADRSVSIGLTQALFNWDVITALRQTDDQIALAESELRATQQELIIRVARAYFDILASQDSLRFSEAENAAVARQLEQSKQRFEVGLSAITDVQESQARFDITVAQKINAQTQLANAQRALAEITNRIDAPTDALRADFPLRGPDPSTPDAWIDAVRKNNPSVLSARLRAELAKADIVRAKAQHLPTLGLEASYTDADGTYNSNGNKSDTANKGSQVQLVARVPIYSGGAMQARVRSSVATEAQRQAEYERIARSAERITGDAFLAVSTGEARVAALKQVVVSSKTAREASQVGLTVGARTAVDVLNAQQQVFGAERDYARARYDYLLSILQLKYAAGMLTEADLAEIDRLLE